MIIGERLENKFDIMVKGAIKNDWVKKKNATSKLNDRKSDEPAFLLLLNRKLIFSFMFFYT